MLRPTIRASSVAVVLTLLAVHIRPVAASGIADLGVRMTVSPSKAAVGQTLTFTIASLNRGPAASSMYVHALLPSTLTITHVDCGPLGPSPDGPFCEYSLVPADESHTMTVTATINSGASGNVVSTACVSSGGDTSDPVAGNNCSSEKVKIQ